MRSALIIDMQRDRLGGGLHPQKGIEGIISPILRELKKCDNYLFILDCHTPNNISFASSHPGKRPGDQISLCGYHIDLFPSHCISGTSGELIIPELEEAFQSARAVDAYTGFRKGCAWHDPGISAISVLYGALSSRRRHDTLTLMGAGESVRATALDICRFFPCQFDIEVKLDCFAYEDKKGALALQEMERAGVKIVP